MKHLRFRLDSKVLPIAKLYHSSFLYRTVQDPGGTVARHEIVA